MSTVQETVQTEMRRNGLDSYEGQAAPVVRALEQREWDIADRLVDFATGHGLPRRDAQAAIEQAGLATRPAVAAVSSNGSNGSNAELAAQIDSLRDTINQVSQALDAIVRSGR